MVLEFTANYVSFSAGGHLLKLGAMNREPQDGYCRFTVPTSSSLSQEQCCPFKDSQRILRVKGR